MAKPALLYMPDGLFSPGFLKAAPAGQTLLANLRDTFEVTVYRWPWFRRSPRFTSLEDEDEYVRTLAEGRHVVCDAGATASMMTALSGQSRRECVVAGGFIPTLATMRVIGAHTVADLYQQTMESVIESQKCHQMARAFLGGLTEKEALALAETTDRDMRWNVAAVAWRLLETVDLINSVTSLDAPFLYVPSTLGGPELEGLVKRFAPNAEIESENFSWPVQVADPEGGHAFARRVRKFIRDNA
jgi:hypothetical protein